MLQSKIVISILIFLVFIVGIGAGFSLFKALNVSDLLSPQRTENKRYLRDELVLSGKDKEGKLFFVRLTFNRKQTSFGNFTHTYTSATVIDETSSQAEFSKESSSDSVMSWNLISAIEEKPASDLSTRESYTFSLERNGQSYDITTSIFEGDYLLKNTIDYTKYISVGTAKVVVQKQDFDVNALLIKSYSEDYSKSIFFEGASQLDSITQRLYFWDTNNNFYYIDQTEEKTVHEKFASYTLVLHKNSSSEMAKVFSGEITHTQNDSATPRKWDVSIQTPKKPRANVEVAYYDSPNSSGTVTGSVTDSDGSRSIHGFAFYGRSQNE